MSDTNPSSDVLSKLEQAEQLKIMGQHEEALVLLESVLLDDPQCVPALEEIADNELSLERYNRAESAAKQAISLQKDSYTGHYILGFIHSHNEEWNTALKHLRTANKLKPNNSEILRCLGWVLFNSDQRAQGIVTLERALNLDHENPLTMCDLGVAYLHMRNFTKSKSLFRHVLDFDAGNERARECLEAVERLEQSIGVAE